MMKHCIALLLLAALVSASCNKALNPQQSAVLQQSISSQHYTFKVESVNPATGGNIQMTPGYDLVINPGSVVATLPYFGRAYFPPDPNSGGFRFTSKQFRYTATPDEKGNWDVVVIPEDIPDVQEMRLSISSDGYATLHITSMNRQAISYNGNILKNKVATSQ
jgi:hypothetical protein